MNKRTNKHKHVTPQLKTLQWLLTATKIKFTLLTMAYKALHDMALAYIPISSLPRSSLL